MWWVCFVLVLASSAPAHATWKSDVVAWDPPDPKTDFEGVDWPNRRDCKSQREPCAEIEHVERWVDSTGVQYVGIAIDTNAVSLRIDWSDHSSTTSEFRYYARLERPLDAAERVRVTAVFADSEQVLLDRPWRASLYTRVVTAPLTRQLVFGLVLIGVLIAGVTSRRR